MGQQICQTFLSITVQSRAPIANCNLERHLGGVLAVLLLSCDAQHPIQQQRCFEIIATIDRLSRQNPQAILSRRTKRIPQRQASQCREIGGRDGFGNTGLGNLFELSTKLDGEFLAGRQKQLLQPRSSARQTLRLPRSQLIYIRSGRRQQRIFPFTRPLPRSIKLFDSPQPLLVSQ